MRKARHARMGLEFAKARGYPYGRIGGETVGARFFSRRNGVSGFTLVEAVVVVSILGVLALFAVPQYMKMSESARADDAASITKQIGMANSIYASEHGGLRVAGRIDNSCNTQPCVTVQGVGPACNLVACGYLSKRDWESSGYLFSAIAPGTGRSCGTSVDARKYMSCSNRCTDGSLSSCTSSEPYSTWQFFAQNNGMVDSLGKSVVRMSEISVSRGGGGAQSR